MALDYYSFRSRSSSPTTYSAPELPKSTYKAGVKPFGAQERTQYKPRSFPEAVQAEDFIPEQATGEVGGIVGAIETGFRAPAYAAERPLALVDQLTGQSGSILDPAAEFVRDLPLVGEHLDNAGKLSENLFDATWEGVGAVNNAQWAGIIDATKDQAPDEAVNAGFGIFDELATSLMIGEFGKFIDPNAAVTKRDLESFLLERGWSEQDFNDIRTGRKGWLDFGKKTIPTAEFSPEEGEGPLGGLSPTLNQANDFITRIGLDPLNLVWGGGALSKAGKFFKAGVATGRGQTSFPKAMRALKIKQSAKAAHPQMGVKALSTNAGVQAINDGVYQGITRSAFSKYLISRVKNPIKGYRDLAIGTTAAQVGLNVADEFIPEDADIRNGLLGDVLDFAEKMGERKPLSKNDLFALGTLMKTPGRTYASRAANGLTYPIRKMRKYNHENVIAAKLFPDLVTTGKRGKDYSKAKAAFVERAGGQAAADNIMAHIVRSAIHEKNFLEGIPSLPDLFHATTLAEAGILVKRYSHLMDRLTRQVLEEGSLTARDFERALDRFTASRGGVIEDLSRGVESAVFRPDDFWATWSAWEPLARKTSEIGDYARPGITADIVTTDGIDWMKAHLDVAKGKTITGQELLDIVRNEPAVLNFPGGEKLAKILTRDGKNAEFQVAEVRKYLNEVRDLHAISRREYVASLEEWEALAGGTEASVRRANHRFNEDGTLADDINPDLPNATSISVQGADMRAVKAAGQDMSSAGLGVIQSMRGTTAGMHYRHSIPAALNLAGIGVRSAVDAIQLFARRGQPNGYAAPSLLLRISPNRPVRDAIDSIAIMLETTGAPRGTAVWRSEETLRKLGLAENATELTFRVGKKTESQWDDLINRLSDEWGDRVTINDTTGVVRVLVPDTQVRGTTARLQRFESAMGTATRERVHFKDVVRRKSDGPTGAVLLKDALADARLNRRYHTAREYIDLGVGGYGGARVYSQSNAAKQARTEARGQYPDRADGRPAHHEPTRWESDSGRGLQGRTREHAVDGLDSATVRDEWTQRVRDAGISDTPRGDRFSFRDGDNLFATGNRNAGVIVRSNGELIPWRSNATGPAPADWGDVLAEASAHATWTRLIDARGPGGRSAVDLLADHGWVPAVRQRSPEFADDVVYLVRDPDDLLGFSLNGRKWDQVREGHNSLVIHGQAARTQAVGLAESLYPQHTARMAQAAEDASILNKLRRISEIDGEVAALQNRLQGSRSPATATRTRDLSDPQDWQEFTRTHDAGGRIELIDGSTHPQGGLATPLGRNTDYLAGDGTLVQPATIAKQFDRNGNLTWAKDGSHGGISVSATALAGPATLRRSSTYRKLMAERERLVRQTSTTAAEARRAAIIAEEVNPGNVTYVADAEKSIRNFKPNLDEAIEGRIDTLPPGEIEKLYALEAEMRLAGSYVDEAGRVVDATNYRLKPLPKRATPYYAEQGEAYRAMVQGRIAAEDGWRTTATSKFAQGTDILFGRRYAIELRNEFRQEVYNELLNAGATPSEVNRFLSALQKRWEEAPSVAGAKVFRSPELLMANQINDLARGKLDSKIFDGFKNVSPDLNVADLVRRASSRKYRDLAKRFPAKDGRGNLGKLIEQYYGKQGGKVAVAGKVGRGGAYAGTVGYTVLRFLLDPRWYLMNALEADILGMARYGSKARGVFGGKARGTGIYGHMTGKDPGVPSNRFIEHMNPRSKNSELLSVEEILHANAGASGWMDPRNLYGYVAEAAKLERPRLTDKMFAQMIDDGSPVIDDLRRLFGDNPQSWYDEIDDMLYAIDTKGAKRAVLENEFAQQMTRAEGPVGRMYEEFLTNLWKQHRKMYQEITHIFHGNVNRANIERLVNNPVLWWPISYQLKAGKWLIDVMTKGFAGNASELAGTGAIYKLIANHQWEMENNDEYRNMFTDHPALWRALSMFVPITPFDMGVFLSRWSRYAGSWTGAQLGLWDQDTSYPQDPISFVGRSLSLGPIYSWDIVGDIFDEFKPPRESKKSTPKRKDTGLPVLGQ